MFIVRRRITIFNDANSFNLLLYENVKKTKESEFPKYYFLHNKHTELTQLCMFGV